jgi:hypothetical protein
MPFLLKIFRHCWEIRRVFRTECIPLNRMGNRAIVTQSPMTRIPLWCKDPIYKLRVVPTHDSLFIPDSSGIFSSGHWCVIGDALNVLTEAVETVVDVTTVKCWIMSTFIVDEGSTDEFLNTLVSDWVRIQSWPFGVRGSVIDGRL